MTKSELKCKDMADVCELAHKRTVRECKKRKIPVNCAGLLDCKDAGQDHDDKDGTHYSEIAQAIFNADYDYIVSVTGL